MKVRVRHRLGKPSSNHPHFFALGWPGGAALRTAVSRVRGFGADYVGALTSFPFYSFPPPSCPSSYSYFSSSLSHFWLTWNFPQLRVPLSSWLSSQGQGSQVCSPPVKSCLPHLPLFMLPSWQIKILIISCVSCLPVLMDSYVRTLLLLGPELLSSLLTADTCCPVDFSQEEMGHRV